MYRLSDHSHFSDEAIETELHLLTKYLNYKMIAAMSLVDGYSFIKNTSELS